MVRPTMIQLIMAVRDLIQDPPAADMAFSDQMIQDVLDQHKRRYRYLPLVPLETILPGGILQYKDFAAPYKFWEQDAVFVDGIYNTITPIGQDWRNGTWTFASEPTRPVRIIGSTYDIYGAAGEILDQWSAKEKECVDFSKEADRFVLSQKFMQIRELAKHYWGLSWPSMSRMVRSDVEGV
jgi:hypothetical protein